MALCAVAAFTFRARRGQARLQPDRHATARDLRVFLCALPVAIVLGLASTPPLRYAGAAVLVAAYALFLSKAIVRARRDGGADAPPPSLYFDTTKHDPPTAFQVLAQTLVGVAMLVVAAELFVTGIDHLAHSFGADELMLTLVIAPLATELPETINSLTWIRQGKDTLALGNITGAMVFQSMLPVAFGLIFTDWRLTTPALLAMLAAAGGAAFSLIVLLRPRCSPVPFIGWWTGLYLGGITSIIAVT
jgi:cation:H+ antiporter